MPLPSVSSVPPPPRDPSPRARELVWKLHGGQGVTMAVGAIFMLAGLAMAVPFNWGLTADIAISASSRTVHARVLSRDLDRSTTINGRHPTEIRFTYSVDGQRYEGRSSTTSESLVRDAQPDATVPIAVSSLNPGWARLPGTTRSTFGYVGLVVLLFPLIGALMLVFSVRAHLRERHVFRYGTPAMAKVVSFGPDYSTRINGRHPFRVRWEFRVDGDARVFTGTLSSMTMLSLEDLGKSEEIVVLYDPDNPEINTAWVP
ncbi:MAG TPA: DUF3592 domain-containing protein [Myxococcales bacterium]|nr:DUF3592 domain-containing protein [Myxococcales bacterium]